MVFNHNLRTTDWGFLQEEEKRGGKKGRLLGIITLSDVLRYTIGEPGIGEGIEKDEELPALESAGS